MDYPLEDLIEIKQRRFDIAVRTLEEKKRLLAKEEEKLRQVEKERDEVLKHKLEKLQQLRDALDSGERIDKIKQMKSYLEVVDTKLLEKEKKVDHQKTQVKKAKEEVEVAKQDMLQKQKDVEKLHIHKEEWTSEAQKQLAQKEAVEHDELGSALYSYKKKERKKHP